MQARVDFGKKVKIKDKDYIQELVNDTSLHNKLQHQMNHERKIQEQNLNGHSHDESRKNKSPPKQNSQQKFSIAIPNMLEMQQKQELKTDSN